MFGKRLRELRKAKGMSQRYLADQVGVDFTYISKVETNALPPPSEKTILAMAQALDVDADELLVLAGKIPSDLAKCIDLETIKQLRARDRI